MDSNIKDHQDYKPVVGISMGDFNGIGPEVIIKALSDQRILKIMTPVVYGSTKVLSFYKKLLKKEEFIYHQVKSAQELNFRKVNVVNCWEENVEVKPGEITEEAGKCAFLSLKKATQELQETHIEAIVTAPINKHNIQNEEFRFSGHTEYFAEKFNAKESLMLLVCEGLRVGVITGHIPLSEVSRQLSRQKMEDKIRILEASLKKDFGINKPKIAILGLNPHAGEEGLLGDEEKNIIKPMIEGLKRKGMLIFGPYPADGFFGMLQYQNYDGILAMYHDQGLIPFKTLAFEKGVNFTAGLSVVRTSPDHGTAYDIAGKDIANESSLREAIFVACNIIKNRKEIILMAL